MVLFEQHHTMSCVVFKSDNESCQFCLFTLPGGSKSARATSGEHPKEAHRRRLVHSPASSESSGTTPGNQKVTSAKFCQRRYQLSDAGVRVICCWPSNVIRNCNLSYSKMSCLFLELLKYSFKYFIIVS